MDTDMDRGTQVWDRWTPIWTDGHRYGQMDTNTDRGTQVWDRWTPIGTDGRGDGQTDRHRSGADRGGWVGAD